MCPSVAYVNNPSHSFSIMYPPVVMLAAPLTVLRIRYPPVVYGGAVNINYWWIPCD
jgi:hypothetical protein